MTPAIRIRILRTAGSTPRDAGTTMTVWADGQDGTIGGGELEYRATALARGLLATGQVQHRATWPLGPDLGQCCGGSVTLVWDRVETAARDPVPTGHPVWIWGAGHVGRAIVGAMAPLPDIAITWADTGADRFPDTVPDGVTCVPVTDLPRLAGHAPRDALHIIVTYSHAIDLALCDALLRRGAGFIGLIGSATKWARFRGRLATLGHSPAQIAGITCPIGDPTLGKHPAAIALGVATQLIQQAQRCGDRDTRHDTRHSA